MYEILVERYVHRFFHETVHRIPTYIDGGYSGPNLAPLPRNVVFGQDIIITGESSIRNEEQLLTTGKSSYIVDLATRLGADTIIDGHPNIEKNDKKISGDHQAYIQEKSGATIRTEAQGLTISDLWMRYVISEKPMASNILFCMREKEEFEGRYIELIEYYIKLIEIYGVEKITPIIFEKAK